MGEFLAGYLQEMGLEVMKQPLSGGRFNLFAQKGRARAVFSTHIDTVSPYIPYDEDEGYLYGRGACDTKGIIAAMLKATEKLLAESFPDFGLLFVVGEEAESDGARAANSIPNQCRWLINGEPTGNRAAVGTKGASRIRLTVRGRACHSGYPELGESAIEKLLDILKDIRAISWPVHPVLGAGMCNIGVISGGVQPNVVAPWAEALLMVRVATSTADVRERLERVTAGRGNLDFYFGYEPVFTFAPEGLPTMVAAYGTDIPFLGQWGRPVLFGPGSILDAHTAREKICKVQLLEAVDHYTALMRRLREEDR